jgi:tRNA threonylcarbamoyladenosine biosynthesis protein TsaE
MMANRTFETHGEEETVQVGIRIGRELRPPQAVLLFGGLGAGKTVMVRGLAQGLGLTDPQLVHSPTFTLVNEYPAPFGTIYHIDLYRLEGARDLYSIGIEDILAAPAAVLFEWAEKLPFRLKDALHIRITPGADATTRRIEVTTPPENPSPAGPDGMDDMDDVDEVD